MNKKQGFATFSTILIINFIVAAIVVTLLTMTLFRVNLAQANINEKVVFYNTESILYDSLIRMGSSFDMGSNTYLWPSSDPLGQNFSSNGIQYHRTFINNSPNYRMEITGQNRYAARQLIGELSMNSAISENDIMIVIDISSSMTVKGTKTCSEWGFISDCSPFNNGTPADLSDDYKITFPIYAAEAAANYFVSLIQNPTISSQTQTGVVLYSYRAWLNKPLGMDHDVTRSTLTGLKTSSGTNTHHGVELAINELSSPRARGGVKKSIVLLTDGSPNKHHNGDAAGEPIINNCNTLTMDPVTLTAPEPCAQKVIDLAISNPDITFYTIGLGFKSGAAVNDKQLFLTAVAQDPRRAFFLENWSGDQSTKDLQGLYGQILAQILAGSSISIREQGAE